MNGTDVDIATINLLAQLVGTLKGIFLIILTLWLLFAVVGFILRKKRSYAFKSMVKKENKETLHKIENKTVNTAYGLKILAFDAKGVPTVVELNKKVIIL